MQACRQRDAADAGIQCRIESGLQCFKSGIHRELFHAVDEKQPIARRSFHKTAHIAQRRFANGTEVKRLFRLHRIRPQGLKALCLARRKARTEKSVADVRQLRVGDVSNAADLFNGKRQTVGGDVGAHAAGDKRREKSTPEIERIGAESGHKEAPDCYKYRSADSSRQKRGTVCRSPGRWNPVLF